MKMDYYKAKTRMDKIVYIWKSHMQFIRDPGS